MDGQFSDVNNIPLHQIAISTAVHFESRMKDSERKDFSISSA